MLITKARESLAVYVGVVHKTDDGRAAVPPRHLREIVIPAIEDDGLGDTVIILPPGAAKTNTMIGACSQWLGQDPTMHVGYVCNTGPEAVKRSLAVRDVIEFSPEYHAMFPDVKPNKGRGWAADNWYLERPNRMDKNPSFTAVGVGGALVGARLHKIVLDDLADEENQKTEQQRKNLHKWLGETMKTRLHPTKGRAVMICTRWHEEDPAAYCIERGWTVIKIPALTEEGESYWPEYYPTSFLACPNDEHNPHGQCCMKKELGRDGFARQYMGEVLDASNARFRPENWREYQRIPADAVNGVISIDTAGWDEKNPRGDYACLTAMRTDGHDFYVEDVQRGQWSFTEVVNRALNMQGVYRLPILVEDVPWARPLIQHLQKTTWGVIAWKVAGRSKFNRTESVVPIHEAGNIWLPQMAGWKAAWLNEWTVWPNGKNDDQIDTGVQALMYLSRYRGRLNNKRPGVPWKRSMAKVSA